MLYYIISCTYVICTHTVHRHDMEAPSGELVLLVKGADNVYAPSGARNRLFL